MKTIQKISALLAASATLSMAGVINVYTGDAKKASASLNLTTIDSLTFSGKAEKKEMGFSGKTKQKAIKLSDIDHMEFKLKDKSKETMTVTVGEGIMEGTHTFNLSEIKNIEIVEMDSEEDMDKDGLTDLEEIYKYDTNPKAADTDGDGWSDKEELADATGTILDMGIDRPAESFLSALNVIFVMFSTQKFSVVPSALVTLIRCVFAAKAKAVKTSARNTSLFILFHSPL